MKTSGSKSTTECTVYSVHIVHKSVYPVKMHLSWKAQWSTEYLHGARKGEEAWVSPKALDYA